MGDVIAAALACPLALRSINYVSSIQSSSDREGLYLDSRTQIHTTRLVGFALILGLVLILIIGDLLKRTELTLLGIAIAAFGLYFYFYRGKLWRRPGL